MRFVLVLVASALLGASGSASAQVSIDVGLPSVRIGVRLGGYPDLVAVPGYPVYYAPQLDSNLFFYDGLYWVYAQDRWYSSSWYDGPWDMMEPEAVPYFVLRVPVQYYRQPPSYFVGWARDAPPRWGEHWGRDWEQRHGDWDRWDRRSAPPPAPLPVYQRQYSGNRYPDAGQQRALRENNYHYQPHEAVVRQQFARPAPAAAPAPRSDQPGNARPAAPSPVAPHDKVPERADRGNTAGTATSRPPAPAPARDTQAASQRQQAPVKQDAQRKPADEGRSAPAPDARRAPVDRPPTSHDTQASSPRPQAAAKQPAQQQPAEQARSAPPPAKSPPQGNARPEQRQERAPQPAAQHPAPAERAREPAAKPQAAAPQHEQKQEAPPPREQKKEPERDH